MLDFLKDKYRLLIKHKKAVMAFVCVLFFAAVFVWLNSDAAFAQETAKEAEKADKTAGIIALILSTVASWVVQLLGWIFSAVMNVTVAVANYNDFANAQAIVLGWVIVRDICNMFFILILLVIAFSVILRVDGYNIKSMIPKLLIMAVLINFSRTICGLLIDAGQVIMLTFIHSMDGMQGGFVKMFGMDSYLQFSKDNAGKPNTGEILVSSLLAIVFMMIATVVVIALLAVLVMRIIMLWIYVTLSPLAFFLASFPQGKGYSQKWWKEFSENIIVGPVLAFFLWLSFATLESVTNGSQLLGENIDLESGSPDGLTDILSGPNVMKFAISIGMLLGGLMISQSMAGVAGGMAGKAMGKIQSGAGWAKKQTVGRASSALKTGAAVAGGAMLGLGAATLKPVPGFVDRLAGKAVGKGFSAVGRKTGKEGLSNIGASLGSAGLVAASMGGLKNLPGNFSNKLRTRMEKDRQLDKDISSGRYNADKQFEFTSTKEGKTYRYNENYQRTDGGKGAYQEWDKNAKDGAGDFKGGDGTVLKDSKNKEVKAMSGGIWGAARAAWSEAAYSATTGSKVARDAAQDKVVGAELSKIKDSGTSEADAFRELRSFSTSAPKKMALALFLASKKAFKDKAEKDEVRAVLGSNSVIGAKFDEDVLKNQPHLAYDMSAKKKDGKGNLVDDLDMQAREKARFKKDVSKGKVDIGNLSKDALDDTTFQNVLHDALTVTIETADGKKIKDDSRYAAMLERNAENNNGANYKNVVKAAESQINRGDISADKMAPLFAKLSGDFKAAFRNSEDKIDYAALGKFFRNTGSKGLARVGSKDLADFTKEYPEALSAIAKEMTATKVRALDKDDDTRDLAEVLRNAMKQAVAEGKADAKTRRESAKLDKDFSDDDGFEAGTGI